MKIKITITKEAQEMLIHYAIKETLCFTTAFLLLI